MCSGVKKIKNAAVNIRLIHFCQALMKKTVFNRQSRAFVFFALLQLSQFFGLLLFACAYASENAHGRNFSPGNGAFSHGLDGRGKPQWLNLESGLEFGEFRFDNNDAKVTVLRIDPEQYEFALYNSTRDGKGPRPLDAWAEEFDLKAAINASMYLPDNGISTGYMRAGDHVNNNRIVKGFGGFFVSEPREPGLPKARILDKEAPGMPGLLDKYDIVIQNYRMANSDRHILWQPGGSHYSISALAQDGSGHILFIHSAAPVEAYTFVQQLLHLPLDIRAILYLEGGAQAGFLLRSDHLKRDLTGAHAPSFLATGNLKARLPNVLGIRLRANRLENEKKPLQN